MGIIRTSKCLIFASMSHQQKPIKDCVPAAPVHQMHEEEWSDSESCSNDLKGKFGNLADCMDSSDESSCDEPPVCPPHAVDQHKQMFVADEVGAQQQQQQPIGAETPGAVETPKASAKKSSRATKKTVSKARQQVREDYAKARVSRKWYVSIDGTLNELASQEKVKWQVSDENHYAHKKDIKKIGVAKQYIGNPKKAVIENVTLNGYSNQAPVAIVVTSPQIEPSTFAQTGEPFLFAMNANTISEKDKVVHDSFEALDDDHMKHFGTCTAESVNSTIGDAAPGVYSVHASSPIVELMEINKKLYGAELYESSVIKVKGEDYVLLNKDTVDEIRTSLFGLLDSLPHVDLTKFSFEFRRADGQPWNSTVGLQTFSGSEEEKRELLDKRFNITFEIDMSHVLPELKK